MSINIVFNKNITDLYSKKENKNDSVVFSHEKLQQKNELFLFPFLQKEERKLQEKKKEIIEETFLSGQGCKSKEEVECGPSSRLAGQNLAPSSKTPLLLLPSNLDGKGASLLLLTERKSKGVVENGASSFPLLASHGQRTRVFNNSKELLNTPLPQASQTPNRQDRAASTDLRPLPKVGNLTWGKDHIGGPQKTKESYTLTAFIEQKENNEKNFLAKLKNPPSLLYTLSYPPADDSSPSKPFTSPSPFPSLAKGKGVHAVPKREGKSGDGDGPFRSEARAEVRVRDGDSVNNKTNIVQSYNQEYSKDDNKEDKQENQHQIENFETDFLKQRVDEFKQTELLINSYTMKSSLFLYQTQEASKNMQQRYQEKTIELAQRYNDQSIEAVRHVA